MKKAKKAKTAAKAKSTPVRASAMRDLELLDPAAKRVKGGLAGRLERPSKRPTR